MARVGDWLRAVRASIVPASTGTEPFYIAGGLISLVHDPPRFGYDKKMDEIVNFAVAIKRLAIQGRRIRSLMDQMLPGDGCIKLLIEGDRLVAIVRGMLPEHSPAGRSSQTISNRTRHRRVNRVPTGRSFRLD